MLSFTFANLFHIFLALVVLSFLTAEPIIAFPPVLIPHLLFLGLFPAFALGLWNWAIARLGSVSTSFFQLFQISIPFFLEIVLFGQIYSSWIYIGILLILASSLLVTEGKNESESVPETQHVRSQAIEPLESITTGIDAGHPNSCCA
jgi:drug/metabolite transporter (DMT)-like permease